MEDSLLLSQVLAGNRNAFRFLVLRYQRPIFAHLATFGFSDSVLEELAQETFLRAFRSLADYQPARGASFATWLFTIARNLALNERARHSHHWEKGGAGQLQMAEAIADPHPDQQSLLSSAETGALVRDALARLPEQFRNAVSLSYLEELSLEEVAGLEGCSVGTVKSRVFRGKQLLRQLLFKEVSAC